MRNKKVSIKED